jgi:hypothetical protein
MERYSLLCILPAREEISVLRIVHDLRLALSPSEEEFKEFGCIDEGQGRVSFDPKDECGKKAREEEREIEIREKATDICVKALREASKAKTLDERLLTVWDKFIKD